MSLGLDWTPAAERDLRRLDPQVRERIRQAVHRFVDTGQGDVQRLGALPMSGGCEWATGECGSL